MNVGPFISLKNISQIKAKKAYLLNTSHPDHLGYHLTQLKTFGFSHLESFPEECDRRLVEYCQRNPVRMGKDPKIPAYWGMPRFSDGVILEEIEMRYLEHLVLSAIAQFNIAIYNWHLPPSKAGFRQKGPDFNIIFSSVACLGRLRVLIRRSDSSLWGYVREAVNYGLAVINSRRRTLNYPLISSVEDAQRRKREANGSLSLAEQINLLNGPIDSDQQILAAIESLGYEVTDYNRDEVRIIRRFCPVVSFEAKRSNNRRRRRAFVVSLVVLRSETIYYRRLRQKEQSQTWAKPAISPGLKTGPSNQGQQATPRVKKISLISSSSQSNEKPPNIISTNSESSIKEALKQKADQEPVTHKDIPIR